MFIPFGAKQRSRRWEDIAEFGRQVAPGMLAGTQEERAPWQPITVGEDNPFELPIVPFQACNPIFAHLQAKVGKLSKISLRQGRGTIGAEHEITTPLCELEC